MPLTGTRTPRNWFLLEIAYRTPTQTRGQLIPEFGYNPRGSPYSAKFDCVQVHKRTFRMKRPPDRTSRRALERIQTSDNECHMARGVLEHKTMLGVSQDAGGLYNSDIRGCVDLGSASVCSVKMHCQGRKTRGI